MSIKPPTSLPDSTLAEVLADGDAELSAALGASLADGSWCRYEGRHGEQLVAALRELLDVEYVYPVCSGTFAVELALRMLKVGPGDEVVLGGYDFAGNYRAIEAVGATPVLVDIVPRRWHVDPVQLEAAASPQVKAVIVSHLHGVLAPMREIAALADRRGWQIVEDACQAPGAIVDGRRVNLGPGWHAELWRQQVAHCWPRRRGCYTRCHIVATGKGALRAGQSCLSA